MNELVLFGKLVKIPAKLSFLSLTSVVVDREGTLLEFLFGRDVSISFFEHMDSEFEKMAERKDAAFNNPAGKLRDLIEDKLSFNP